MNATISRENLLASLLTLSRSNQKWIADHLYENIAVGGNPSPTMSKEEVLTDLSTAFQELKAVQEGKLKPITMEELFNEL